MAAKGFCTPKWLLILTGCFVLLLIIVIVVVFTAVPPIVQTVIKSQIEIKEGTSQWDRFLQLPVPFEMKLYFFEIQNRDEVQHNGAIPQIVEKGPYIYDEFTNRTVLEQDDDEDTISYLQSRTITFNQEKSGNLTENDTIIIVNPVILVLSQMTTPLEQLAVVGCLDQIFPVELNSLFIEINIKTAVLEGFVFAENDKDYGHACGIVRNLVIEKASTIKNIEVRRDENGTVTELAFAFLQFKIREPDHEYVIKRGQDDVSQLGNIIRWNNTERLTFWGRTESTNNDTCQVVRGSDSTLYPPDVTDEDYFEIFSTDVCRTVKVSYKETGSYKGIDGYKFSVDNTTFRSATPNPENDCYCTKTISNGGGEPSCFLDGIVDVMPCFHAPVLLSFPHFLYAEEYLNGVEGMEPADLDTHGIYLLIEPNTGIPLQGMKRVQLNMVLRPVQYVSLTKNLPGTVLPLVWLEEGVSLSQDLIDELNDRYFNIMKVVNGVKYALIALFAAAVCVSGVFYLRKRHTSKIK